MARRLLSFSRQGELRAEPVEPAPLIAGLEEMLTHALEAKVRVGTEVAPDLPAVLADKAQLETVLLNLVTNARDAMPEGGALTLAATLDVVPASRNLAAGEWLAAGEYVRFTVVDTGTGMDPATLARATEPFFTTKPINKGTGLGLAMARGFAEQSGGALALESTQSRGTSVSLWLPVAGARPPVTDFPRPTPAAGPDAPHVLLVEDEELVRDVLAAQLQESGFRVSDVADGAAALGLLAAEEIDVLVSDLAMPGMDGLALIREARRHCPGLPAVLLTGHAGDPATLVASGSLPEGRFTLLRKPVPAEHLADGIAVLLAER